jgi:hypothetical protein
MPGQSFSTANRVRTVRVSEDRQVLCLCSKEEIAVYPPQVPNPKLLKRWHHERNETSWHSSDRGIRTKEHLDSECHHIHLLDWMNDSGSNRGKHIGSVSYRSAEPSRASQRIVERLAIQSYRYGWHQSRCRLPPSLQAGESCVFSELRG